MIKLVVFDMAGTVVDEQNLVYKTVQKAIERAGHQTDLHTVLRYAAGKEKRTAIQDVLQHLYGQTHDDEVDRIFADFKQLLKTAYQTEPINPQPWAEETFAALKARGVKVALNTGYDRPTAEHLLKRLNWTVGKEIDTLITASDVERGRPFPDMIHLAMERLGVQASAQTVKIGDSIIDIEEGQQAGCGFSLGITTGAHNREQLASAAPEGILDRLAELISFLEGKAAL